VARGRTYPWKAVATAAGAAFVGSVGLFALWNRSSSATTRAIGGGPVKPVLPPPVRVALIGDSYAVGLGPYLAKRFPDFQFEGHVGTNTTQWANHAPACGACGDWLTDFRPTVVLISLGVNDGNAPDSANYHAIVSALHGIGARAIWIEPPAGVNTPAVRQVIASLGVPTVPATMTPLGADRLHPQSYAPWANEIAQVVLAT
jgi:lysophospholipase L1-like esterase